MRALVLAIGALVIVAACGRVPGGQVTVGDYKVYEAASTGTSPQVSVIDSRSHSIERSMPLGTPSADWSHLYTVNGNTLVEIDPLTGAVRHRLQLPGTYQLPDATISGVPGGLSHNARWLVLESFDAKGNFASASHFVVVDTTYVKQPQRIDLNGYFQFDAINDSGGRVYLIQYLSGNSYYVRFYNAFGGYLDPTIVFDKSDGSAAMAGTRLSGVGSTDGQWLYSVYTRPDKSAFIHALNLENPIAFCIDLPGSGYSTNPGEFHWSVALNAAGTHLYAANGATGVVADLAIDNGTPSLQPRIVHLAVGQASSSLVQDVQAKELGGNAAAVSPDGRTLVISGQTGLVWIDTLSLKAGDRQLSSWAVRSVALSPDGTTLYAVNDSGMIAELPMNGSHAPTTFGGAVGQPLALIRVEGVPGS